MNAIAEARERYDVDQRTWSMLLQAIMAGAGIYIAYPGERACFGAGVAIACLGCFFIGWNAGHIGLIVVQEEMDTKAKSQLSQE